MAMESDRGMARLPPVEWKNGKSKLWLQVYPSHYGEIKYGYRFITTSSIKSGVYLASQWFLVDLVTFLTRRMQ